MGQYYWLVGVEDKKKASKVSLEEKQGCGFQFPTTERPQELVM